MVVANDRFFRRALAYGDIASASPTWTATGPRPSWSRSFASCFAISVMSSHPAASYGWSTACRPVCRRLRDNSVDGSRNHIHRHYDLGNDFFSLFLDARHLMYSCGFYESATDSLEAAQEQKLERICRKLDLSPGDHVLEIGTGWGGFAIWRRRTMGAT